jgi:predicted ATPase
MKIIAMELSNVRGFEKMEKTNFSSSINIFVGPNNSGKSTVLNSIYMLQRNVFTKNDVSVGQTDGSISIYVGGDSLRYIPYVAFPNEVKFDLSTGNKVVKPHGNLIAETFNLISSVEPSNLIYPYLAKRKTFQFNDTINERSANAVDGNFGNLYSKVDRLIAPQFQPANGHYIRACKEILGYEISTIASENGKKAVFYIKNLDHIPLTAMGEGVTSIIGLLSDLCIAEEKVFLLEELENDIHPKALKALLNLIIEKSKTNQFFISTHSNIVMKYLGGESEAKIFRVWTDKLQLEVYNKFSSHLEEVNNQEERLEVLEELGYEPYDYDLWKGWLFLEESSAETIIRDYLIDWFVPSLKGKLRTFSAGGYSNILPKFEDFDRLFVFLHLVPTYRNKVWVAIDSGDDEAEVISRMRQKYQGSGWKEDNFTQFSKHDFEDYYPQQFRIEVQEIKSEQSKKKRTLLKKELLLKVRNWIHIDEKIAKSEFKNSAHEVIIFLTKIAKEL